MSQFGTTLTRNLRRARDSAGLDRNDLAELTGMPVTTIASIEGGAQHVRAYHVALYAEALGCSIDSLYEGYRADARTGLDRRPTPVVHARKELSLVAALKEVLSQFSD